MSPLEVEPETVIALYLKDWSNSEEEEDSDLYVKTPIELEASTDGELVSAM